MPNSSLHAILSLAKAGLADGQRGSDHPSVDSRFNSQLRANLGLQIKSLTSCLMSGVTQAREYIHCHRILWTVNHSVLASNVLQTQLHRPEAAQRLSLLWT